MTFVLTVVFDLVVAIEFGMLVACILFMKNISDLVESEYQASALESDNDKHNVWKDEESVPSEVRKQIYIIRVDGPLFFGSVTRFNDLVKDVPSDAKNVIIRMKMVEFLDQSGLYALETAIKDLREKGMNVYLTHLCTQPKDLLAGIRLVPEILPEENIYPSFGACMESFRNV